MSGILSDIELRAFEVEEMRLHYMDGFCGAYNCPFCLRMKQEREYWEEYEQEEFNRICGDDIDED